MAIEVEIDNGCRDTIVGLIIRSTGNFLSFKVI